MFLRSRFLSGCVHRDFLLLSQKSPFPLPLPLDNNLLRAPVPLRCALVSHLEVRVVLLTVAVHVAPPLPAAPLGWAFNKHSLHTLLVCCPHAELKKPHLRKKRAVPAPPPPNPARPEDAARIPTKPTARGEECFRV